jgi:hypothetical protein
MPDKMFILPEEIYDDVSDIFDYIRAMHQIHRISDGKFGVVVNDEKSNKNYHQITANLKSAVFFVSGIHKGMMEQIIKQMHLTDKYCCTQYGNHFYAFYKKIVDYDI